MQMGLAADAAQVLREQLAASGPDPKAELTLARALLLKNSSLDEKLRNTRRRPCCDSSSVLEKEKADEEASNRLHVVRENTSR